MKIKSTYFLFIFSLISLISSYNAQENVQNVKGVYQANTNNGGNIVKTEFDNNGNNITIGYTNGIFKFADESINSTGIEDLFIFKNQNDSGTKVWSKVINAGSKGSIRPNNIKISNQNEIYISANYEGTINIDGKSFTSNSLRNGILLKFDENGNFLWGTHIPFHDLQMNCSDIAITDNHVFLLFQQNVIYNINVQDGSVNNFRLFKDIVLGSIEANNTSLFIGGHTIQPMIIDEQTIPTGAFILKASNQDMSVSSSFQITTPQVSGSVYDVNDILLQDHSLLLNVKIYDDNQLTLKGNNYQSTISSNNYSRSYLWIAKIDENLNNVNWNRFISSYGITQYYFVKFFNKEANNINLYIDSATPIDLEYPQYGNIRAGNTLFLPIANNDGSISESFFSLPAPSFLSFCDYKNINNTEYISQNYGDAKIYKRTTSSMAYTNISTRTKESNKGSIRGAFLLTRENGDIYQAANFSKAVNFKMGNPITSNTSLNNIILSKINSSKIEEYQILGNEFSLNSDQFDHKVDVNKDNEYLVTLLLL